MRRLFHSSHTSSAVLMLVLLSVLFGWGVSPSLAQAGSTAIIIQNNSDEQICYIYMSPSNQQEWGSDWLGTNTVLAAGDALRWSITTGSMDLRMEDCQHELMLEQYQMALTEAEETLVLFEARGQATVMSGSSVVGSKQNTIQGGTGTSSQPSTAEDVSQDTNSDELISGDDMEMGDLVTLISSDLDDYWTGVFADEGVRYVTPGVSLYSSFSIDSGCGTVDRDMGPLYCPRDNNIYLPAYFMEEVRTYIGDFSVATVIGHEWGHAVQTQFGIESEYSIVRELRADCFAGSYGAYIETDSERIILDEGDLEEGATLLYEIGDPASVDWFDRDAHGQPQQRSDAYDVGHNGYIDCLSIDVEE
jgi:uncharacterized protein